MKNIWRRIIDEMIFVSVGMWIIVTMRREWLRLVYRQLKYGLFRVRVAVPRLANEKFLWRKAFDHDPRWVRITDKADAKEWIKDQNIDVAMPETLWVGADAGEIPDEIWQRPFYLKATHGCQMNIPVLTPPKDKPEIIKAANNFLGRDHGSRQRQWAYSLVPRRLIAEEAICPDTTLIEIKYYVFGNIVEQFVLRRNETPVTAGRWERTADGTYELSEERTAVSAIIDRAPLPDVVMKGLKLASEIGERFDHIRVDTLTDGKTLYLGELTVYNLAGRVYNDGANFDNALNRSWDLRQSWFLTEPQSGWRMSYAAALRRQLDRRAVQR